MTTLLQTRADEMKALVALRKEVQRAGLEKQTPALALAIVVFHLVAMLGGIAVFVAFDSLWVRLAALAVSTYGSLGIGMIGHNASHSAVTGNKKFDRALMFLTMTVLHGVSGNFWRQKHVQLHHAGPNNIGIDTDIELLPLFALSEEEMAQARGWQRKFFRIQHWVFPIALCCNVFNLQQTGMRHLVGEIRKSGKRRMILWADVGCLVLHYTAFLAVPALIWSVWPVIGFYLLREVLNSYIMFAAAAPPHFPAEAMFVKAESDGPGMLACQLYTTVNFRTGFWGRLVCLGAEYQIEHHLLPNANPLKMRRISEIVQAFCGRHGYPYRSLGWWEGVWKSLASVKTPKRVLTVGELMAFAAEARA